MTEDHTESSSSTEMEEQRQWPELAKLGHEIVQELGLEDSNNVLAIWLAHYLAEQLGLAEKAIDQLEKQRAQKKCSELILKVWASRDNWPIAFPLNAMRPTLHKILSENGFGDFHFLNLRKNEPKGIMGRLIRLQQIEQGLFARFLLKELPQEQIDKNKEWLDRLAPYLNEDEIATLTFTIRFTSDPAAFKQDDQELSEDFEEPGVSELTEANFLEYLEKLYQIRFKLLKEINGTSGFEFD